MRKGILRMHKFFSYITYSIAKIFAYFSINLPYLEVYLPPSFPSFSPSVNNAVNFKRNIFLRFFSHFHRIFAWVRCSHLRICGERGEYLLLLPLLLSLYSCEQPACIWGKILAKNFDVYHD
jgi:hypothetical protein